MVLPTAVAIIAVLVPFAVHNFLQGKHVLNVWVILTIIALSVTAYAIYYKKDSKIPLSFSSIPLICALNTAIFDNGAASVFWCFPTTVINSFFYSKKFSRVCNITLFLTTTLSVFVNCELDIFLRFTACLGLMIFAMNYVLRVQETLHSKLHEQSVRDPLTNTYNRRLLDIRLNEAVEQKKRKGAVSSILLLDLDFFKKINDSFGHRAGDRILVKFAEIIKETTRSYDTLFRVGGEEFLLFMPDINEQKAGYVAEKIQKAISNAKFDIAFPVTVTIGVSEVRATDSVESWIASADKALYHGKNSGRNCIIKRGLSESQKLLHIPVTEYSAQSQAF